MFPRDGQYTILDEDSTSMINYPRAPDRGYARNGDLMPNKFKKYEILQNRQVNQWGGNISPVQGTMLEGMGREQNGRTVGEAHAAQQSWTTGGSPLGRTASGGISRANWPDDGMSRYRGDAMQRSRPYIQEDLDDSSPDDLTYEVKFPGGPVNYIKRPLEDINNIEAIRYNQAEDDPRYEPNDQPHGNRDCLGTFEHFSSCVLCQKLSSANSKIYIIVIAILIMIIGLLLVVQKK